MALQSSNDKLYNFCFNNKVFSQGKCWQQFMAQHFVAPTLHKDSFDNTFSILKMEPSKSTTFCFFLWKEYYFSIHQLLPNHQHLTCGFSLNEIKCFIKGYPSRIVKTNSHFQMVIIGDTIVKQYKMQSPTWSSPSWSSRTISCGLHITTRPFARKTLASSTRSHSAPRHLNWHFPNIFEFLPITPWPCIASSFTHAFP